VASERTDITQVKPGEYRMYTEAGHAAPRVVLAESVLAAANTTAGQGRAAFEAELTDRGVQFMVNQAATGTVSGYRFAAHTDDAGEPVWSKRRSWTKNWPGANCPGWWNRYRRCGVSGTSPPSTTPPWTGQRTRRGRSGSPSGGRRPGIRRWPR